MTDDVDINFRIPKWVFITSMYALLVSGSVIAGGFLTYVYMQFDAAEVERRGHDAGFQEGRESCTEPGGLERAAKWADRIMMRHAQ